MLRTANHIIGYGIAGNDGDIGHCSDFLFRDDDWSISYLAVDTGRWLPGKKVVIPPSVVSRPDWESKTIPVSLTIERIKGGPTVNSKDIVSRDYEKQCLEYYKWPAIAAASISVAGPVVQPTIPRSVARSVEALGDNHLRSMNVVKTYKLEATDGEIGFIEDLILDDESWRVRYFVACTSAWKGKDVLVSPQWIESIDWADKRVKVDLPINSIKSSPNFDPAIAINREYEARLYNYYGKPVDW